MTTLFQKAIKELPNILNEEEQNRLASLILKKPDQLLSLINQVPEEQPGQNEDKEEWPWKVFSCGKKLNDFSREDAYETRLQGFD